MQTRHLLATIVTLLLVATSPIVAQSRPATIAVVLSLDAPPYREALGGFEDVLEQSGRDYRIHEFIASGAAAKRGTLITKIRNKRPDLIFTVGSAATQMVIDEIDELPIVFSMVFHTSGNRSLEAMRREHFNVTGVAMEMPVAAQLAEIKRLLPSMRRIGVMFNPETSGPTMDATAGAALALGLQLVPFPVSNDKDLVAWTSSFSTHIDVLWSFPDSALFSEPARRHLLLETLRQRIPFIAPSPSLVRAGALFAFSTNYRDLGKQAAEQSLEILDGRSADQLPLARPRLLELSINMNTARRIRVEIDEETRSRADAYF